MSDHSRDVRDLRDLRDIPLNEIRDEFTIEEKLITSVWVHDRSLSGKSMDELRMNFEQRFGKNAPKHDQMIGWERSAFATGSVLESVPHMSQSREQQQHYNRMHNSQSQAMDGRGGGQQMGGQRKAASSFHPSLYKTELCRQYYEYGYCDYGDRCLFAHGKYELKKIPNYKTKLCASYHSSGYCSFGSRCAFIHKKHEARQPDAQRPRHTSSRSIRPNRRTDLSRKK